MVENYKVITLCGSTKFKDQFMEVQKKLTLEGNIVISVGLFGHSGDQEVWDGMDEGTLSKTKKMLDDMHKRKIDMADEIFVINVGGYIGESTKSEIEYAKKTGKIINYLEPKGEEISYKNLIDVNEFQTKLLEYINSKELDNMIKQTIFKDKQDCKMAINYGISLASMLTTMCKDYYMVVCK